MAEAEQQPPAEQQLSASYWLIIVQDEAESQPQCIRCENAKSLQRAIEEHVLSVDKPLHAFAFNGERIDISSPRPVCSLKIDGVRHDVGSDQAEFDEGGRIVPLTKSV